MSEKTRIHNFYDDLSGKCFILHIENIDISKLEEVIERDGVYGGYRLKYALSDMDPTRNGYICFDGSCLQLLTYTLKDYIDAGYAIYDLHEDSDGYYMESKI